MIPVPTLLAGNGSTFFTGCSKTGIPGASVLGVVLLANLLEETRASVGVLLPLLISADLFAVGWYRRHADWRLIRRLLPWTLCGLALGAVALQQVRGEDFNTLLGGAVLGILLLEILRERMGWDRIPHHPAMAAVLGVTAGFTTTIGNLAGPVMSLYLLSLGLEKHRFMGSMAWFFLLINVTKVPIFIASGLITPTSLSTSVWLLPGIVIGALAGRWLFVRIPQGPFRIAVQVLAAGAALRLLMT